MRKEMPQRVFVCLEKKKLRKKISVHVVVAMQTKTHGENIKQPNQPGTKRSDEPFVCQKVQKLKYKNSK
jgi:hypothetical protein